MVRSNSPEPRFPFPPPGKFRTLGLVRAHSPFLCSTLVVETNCALTLPLHKRSRYGQCLTAEARHAVQGHKPLPLPAAAAPAAAKAAGGGGDGVEGGAVHWAGEGGSGSGDSGGGGSSSSDRGRGSGSGVGVGAALGPTGNKAADDDIAAFQQARDELYALQRRQQQKRPS